MAAPTNHTVLTSALDSGTKWSSNEVFYYYAPGGTATYTGGYSGGSPTTSTFSAADKAAVEFDMSQFSAVCGLTFTEVGSSAAANIRLQKVEEVPGGFGGYADYPSGAGSTAVLGAEWITESWSNLVLHELGHAVGLAHSFDGTKLPGVNGSSDPGDFNFNNLIYTTMAYNGGKVDENPTMLISADLDALGALDIAALQIIYGANMDTATGDDSYGRINRAMSIWDAGGADEINFSDASTTTVIDLRAATLQNEAGGAGFASYSLYDTGGASPDYAYTVYTIAYGVVIENAVGGAFNDKITGNAAGNTISGGDGRDAIKGLAGNDDIDGGGHADRINGGGGRDIILGGAGKDRIDGGGGADTLTGNGGRDDLNGGNGNDKLRGGGGADTLTGGRNNDVLTGGGHNDVFVFGAGQQGNDRITDIDVARETISFAGSAVTGMDKLSVTDKAAGTLVAWDKGSVLLLGVAAANVGDGLFDFA